MIEAGDNRPMLELRVVDMTSVVFGPIAPRSSPISARVIKVEAPGGDVFRHDASRTPGMAPGYIALNRGKQSLLLDLKQDADQGY